MRQLLRKLAPLVWVITAMAMTAPALLAQDPVLSKPGAPSGVSLEARLGGFVVTWDPPTSDGNAPIIDYDVSSVSYTHLTLPTIYSV